MSEQHTGAGVCHDISDLVPHDGLVAMDLALQTGRLVCLERACFEPLDRIGQQLFAVRAQPTIPMLPVTIESHHHLDGSALSGYSGGGAVHAFGPGEEEDASDHT